jgi:hypothetical protein
MQLAPAERVWRSAYMRRLSGYCEHHVLGCVSGTGRVAWISIGMVGSKTSWGCLIRSMRS